MIQESHLGLEKNSQRSFSYRPGKQPACDLFLLYHTTYTTHFAHRGHFLLLPWRQERIILELAAVKKMNPHPMTNQNRG